MSAAYGWVGVFLFFLFTTDVFGGVLLSTAPAKTASSQVFPFVGIRLWGKTPVWLKVFYCR
jgi:hypothetical protein